MLWINLAPVMNFYCIEPEKLLLKEARFLQDD